jgi:hypothetical protein
MTTMQKLSLSAFVVVLAAIGGLLVPNPFASVAAQEKKNLPTPIKPVKHAAAPLVHNLTGLMVPAFNPNDLKFQRGLSGRTVGAVFARVDRFVPKKAAPASVLMLAPKWDMWGNDQYGDCVSASEAACKAAYSIYCKLPETFIPSANVISWASKYGYLNGANLTDVMTTMHTNGMVADDGKTYTDGPFQSVDYSNEATLQAAIAVGPVNTAIDANALPSMAGNQNGWYAFGGSPGQFGNTDHCVPIVGYGPTADLVKAINSTYNVTMTIPAGAPANSYIFFTWSTVGLVDHAWIMSTVVEAWVRNPTTTGQTPGPNPNPNPNPPPPGVPIAQKAVITFSDGSTQTIDGTAASPTVTVNGVPYVPAGSKDKPCPLPAPVLPMKKVNYDNDRLDRIEKSLAELQSDKTKMMDHLANLYRLNQETLAALKSGQGRAEPVYTTEERTQQEKLIEKFKKDFPSTQRPLPTMDNPYDRMQDNLAKLRKYADEYAKTRKD